jgi:hypothetical protein
MFHTAMLKHNKINRLNLPIPSAHLSPFPPLLSPLAPPIVTGASVGHWHHWSNASRSARPTAERVRRVDLGMTAGQGTSARPMEVENWKSRVQDRFCVSGHPWDPICWHFVWRNMIKQDKLRRFWDQMFVTRDSANDA